MCFTKKLSFFHYFMQIDKSAADDAQRYIALERAQFKPDFEIILQICRERKIIIYEPAWLADNKISTELFTPTKLILYSDNLVDDAKHITDKLAVKRPGLVVMKSKIPHKEIEIFASGRQLITMFKHIGVQDYEEIANLRVLNVHSTLIDIYHKLYAPFPEEFKKALLLERVLYKMTQPNPLELIESKESKNSVLEYIENNTNGGSTDSAETIFGSAEENASVAQKLRKILDENNLGIIIGFWGAKEIAPKIDTKYEKLQIITDRTADNLAEYLKPLGPVIAHMSWDIQLKDDYWLRKTTFYVKKSGDSYDRVPVLDAYNAMTYELVPRIMIQGSFTGTVFVLARFFLVDYWMLHQLWKQEKINKKVFFDKTDKILKALDAIRPYKKYWFSTDYVGVYKDLLNEKRLLSKLQTRKIADYKGNSS